MKRNYKAFTLVELLLALTIFSIISLSLYSTFSSGLTLSRRSERTSKIYREIRWTLDTMSKDLENMASYDFSNSYGGIMPFVGAADKVIFLLPEKTGLREVSYYLKSLEAGSILTTIVGRHSSKKSSILTRFEEKNSLRALAREEKSFIDSLQATNAKETESDLLSLRVVDGGLKFSYAYVEGKAGEEKVIWKDTWQEPYIPSSILVTITFLRPEEGPLTIEKKIYIPTGYLGRINP